MHLFYDKGSFTADYINDFSHLSGALAARPGNQISLRHEYIDPAEHRDYYISCYSDAWLASHGDLRGFVPETYYAAASRTMRTITEPSPLSIIRTSLSALSTWTPAAARTRSTAG